MDGMVIPQTGRVGPNAVLQLRSALSHRGGLGLTRQVFDHANLDMLLRYPPDEMVDETMPALLFSSLWALLSGPDAAATAREAGQRTADYILANRIPGFAQVLLKSLPMSLSRPLLLKAILKSAWTFAGSGVCRVQNGNPASIEIEHNPIPQPGCVWHVAVFERLFRTLVSVRSRVRHTECILNGAPACRFEIRTR